MNENKHVFDKLRSIHMKTKATNTKLTKLIQSFHPSNIEFAIKYRAKAITELYGLN